MLLQFSAANYRSIRDEQRLTLAAAASDELERSNVVDNPVPGVGRILRSAVIYGANAAGKSNLLRALDLMQDLVLDSAKDSQAGDVIPVVPFLLDESSAARPSTFEVVFIAAGTKYQYGFSATSRRIVSEWLYAYPEKRAQRWFFRSLEESTGAETWEFGPHFKGGKIAWRDATRPNALFLSTAVQLNARQLMPVFDWFREKLRMVLGRGELAPTFSMNLVGSPDTKEKISALLRSADVGIEDVEVADVPVSDDVKQAVARVVPEQHRERVLKDAAKSARLRHSSPTGQEVWLDLEDESQGTQKLFAFAGPLVDVLGEGLVLVVDELNNSLHPLLVRHIIESFHSVDSNPHGAQIIFACHATSILTLDLFRRDQIWFAEKASDGSTKLYALSEFSPRRTSSIAKGYLQGRYGAIPFLGGSMIADE
jgi:hypothetical protein